MANASTGVALIAGSGVLFWLAWFSKPPAFGSLPALIDRGDGGIYVDPSGPGVKDAPQIDTLVNKYFPAIIANRFRCIWRRESPSNRIGAAGEIGIFQIHPVNWPTLIQAGIIRKSDDLFDYETNIKAARLIYDRQGISAWTTAPLCPPTGSLSD